MATKKITEAQVKKNQVTEEMTLEAAESTLEASLQVLNDAFTANKLDVFTLADEICKQNLKAYNAKLTASEYAKLADTDDPLMSALEQRDIDVLKVKSVKDETTKQVTGYSLNTTPKMINLKKFAQFCEKHEAGCIFATETVGETRDDVAAAARMLTMAIHNGVNARNEFVWETSRRIKATDFTNLDNLKILIQACVTDIGGASEDGVPNFELEDEDFNTIMWTATKVASHYKGSDKACVLAAATESTLWDQLTIMLAKCVGGYGYEVEDVVIKK